MIEVYKARRKALAKRFPSHAILIANGDAKVRSASHYPFRGNSNFVYLCGAQLPGSFLLIVDGKSHLFLEPVSKDWAVWHGKFPDTKALATKYGFDSVMPKEQIVKHLVLFSCEEVMTLPSSEVLYNKKLEALIGRAPDIFGIDRPLADAIIEMRSVHCEEAVGEIRKAVDITVEAINAVKELTKSGVSERELRARAIYEFSRNGMEPAFQPIVSVHGEILHNYDYDNVLTTGDMLLVDIGAETHTGYAADLTRTWPVAGDFSAEQKAIYDVVLSAQQTAISSIKVGAEFKDLHLMACGVFCEGLKSLGILKGDVEKLVSDGTHALFMPHGLGHLVGLDVHDMEDLGDIAAYAQGRKRSEQFGLNTLRLDRNLVPGMCVSIEFGYYNIPAIFEDDAFINQHRESLNFDVIEKFSSVRGIRIEDQVFIGTDKVEVLSAKLLK